MAKENSTSDRKPVKKTIYNATASVTKKHFANVRQLISDMRAKNTDEKDTDEIESVLFVLNSAVKANNERIEKEELMD